MSSEKVNYGEVVATTGFYMALNEGDRVDMARSSPQEVRIAQRHRERWRCVCPQNTKTKGPVFRLSLSLYLMPGSSLLS
ncbi:hypothetical protein ACU60D_17825, partial [Klebsiella aerogenes]